MLKEIQQNVMDRYWQDFDESDENKLVYFDIFNEYTQLIEQFINEELNRRMKDFDMNRFTRELQLKL